MKLQPLHKRMIIDQDPEEQHGQSGVIITDDIRTFRRGTIKEMGPECEKYEIGDRIIYVKEATEEIIVDEGLPNEERFVILYNEDDIYAKIK